MKLPPWAFSWSEVAVQYTACVLISPLWLLLKLLRSDAVAL